MKLNPDCIRETLTYLENLQSADTGAVEEISLSALYGSVLGRVYDKSDLYYSVKQLHDSGLIDAHVLKFIDGSVEYEIIDISPSGHAFLDNIRDLGRWTKIKTAAAKAGTVALNSLIQIAVNAASGILKG